jgi:uridylate kinase
MKIVFKLGGSVISPNGIPDINYLKKFSKFVIGLKRKHKILIVTGAGKFAKEYIKLVRKFGTPENFLDTIGILGTRMNAMVLIASLGKHAHPHVIKHKDELEDAMKSGKIPVMGGLKPGITTDAVSIGIAELVNADLVIKVTDVDGIYDKDPDKYKNAKMFKEISLKRLSEITKKDKYQAGKFYIMDPVSVKLLKRSKILLVVLGKNINNIKNFINKKSFKGTIVS